MSAEKNKGDSNLNDKNPMDENNPGEVNSAEITDNFPDENEDISDSEAIVENEEIALLKNEIDKLNESILRERAEFQNYRKRTSQESLLAEGRTAGKILQEALPAFDSLDQLLSTARSGAASMEKFIEGAELIKKQLWQIFENLGVEEINPEQMEFDPQLMEALSVQEADDVTSDQVTQVYQKGYRYKERILRPARVAVKKPKA